jgi:1-acyl-sn-glycerol-3-phosphate acyltransferase
VAGSRDEQAAAQTAGVHLPINLFQRAATSLPGSRTVLPTLRSALRLTLTAWHIARGVYIVGAVFPRLDTAQRQLRVQRWSCAVLRSLGVNVQVHGRLHTGAQMLVANHVSWLDVIVLQALFPHARFVSKAEVQHWPLIGRLVVGVGTFFVERDRPRQTGRSIDAIAAALAAGETVTVFPEGTTSDGHAVLPFRASLLQAALRAAVPVRPLALRYADAHHPVSRSAPYIDDDTMLGSLWRTARAEGLLARVQVLAVEGPAAAHRRPLAVALHSAIQTALDAGPPVQLADRVDEPAGAQSGRQAAILPADS